MLRKLRKERLIKENEGQLPEKGDYSKKKYQPAIQFRFGNGVLLDLLKTRAAYIEKGEYHKARKVEDQMTEYKSKHLEELMRPRKAYVIFMDQWKFYDALKTLKTFEFVVPTKAYLQKLRNQNAANQNR